MCRQAVAPFAVGAVDVAATWAQVRCGQASDLAERIEEFGPGNDHRRHARSVERPCLNDVPADAAGRPGRCSLGSVLPSVGESVRYRPGTACAAAAGRAGWRHR
jgi:hypothetical protein